MYCSLNELCYSEKYMEGISQQVYTYCSLNEVRHSEHYMEDTSQQVDTGFAA